ncbi:hypothetical protein [Arcanobacterium pinnipediorum]|uniref:TadE-like protein n=1 Tax=Arcanobacterium pinnipediorum TaxID=1503041 RepID=A0ABY5AID7_9ACTO|nr:hypothetical protein [Arcanobacterium pinnipediorum]USR78953.1 hypothetical protein NG665_06055 [Arcanobacterium pinnipediorum]
MRRLNNHLSITAKSYLHTPRYQRRGSYCGAATRAEPGNAVVEFVGIMVVIISPALILLICLSTILGAQFGVEAAARDVARDIVRAERVDREAQVALATEIWEQRGYDEPLEVAITCSTVPCLTPGNEVSVSVSALIELPVIGVSVLVDATQSMPVDLFRQRR